MNKIYPRNARLAQQTKILTHHIKRIKDKSQIIISIDANLLDKNTQQTRNKEGTNLILNGEKLKAFPFQIWNETRMLLLFNIMLEVLAQVIRQQKTSLSHWMTIIATLEISTGFS